MFTNEERMAKFRTAPKIIAEIYGAESTTQFIKNLRERFSITNSVFVDLVGDMILGLYPQDVLPTLLANELGLAGESLSRIAAELNHFLDSIPAEVQVPVRNAGPVSNFIRPSAEADAPRTPLTKDELMKALEAKRTMKSDIETMREKLKAAAEPRVGYNSLPPQE